MSSCNGCRVLRKGCMANCVLRPCLEWIGCAEWQANATFFLAKFYGRAGLINLIGWGHTALRPAIFKSLLYEACGRIINPVYGSVGLLWSGNWSRLESAVDGVLRGIPVAHVHSHLAPYLTPAPPLQLDYGSMIRRHTATVAPEPRVTTARARFKRSAPDAVPEADAVPAQRRKRTLVGVNVGQGGPGTSGGNAVKEEVDIDLTLSLMPPSS